MVYSLNTQEKRISGTHIQAGTQYDTQHMGEVRELSSLDRYEHQLQCHNLTSDPPSGGECEGRC